VSPSKKIRPFDWFTGLVMALKISVSLPSQIYTVLLNPFLFSMASCGIDFGTSNSSSAVFKSGSANLVAVEKQQLTIPSALFFQRKVSEPYYGREAVRLFFARTEGRFMRSLKRVLGTSLMTQGTAVNGKPMKFDAIIASFLKNLKTKTELFADEELTQVVMGRPVHFLDHDTAGDHRAQEELKSIAQHIGFKHVEFQFEPIAAAFAHEANLTQERLAIVADLGGGTSDFTVIRLSQKYRQKADRTNDILANTGIRVGGNDFDKALSLAVIMPEIGYRTTYGEKNLEVPIKPYHDLAEWSKVNMLYTVKMRSQVRQIYYQAHDKIKYERLLKVLEQETGHALLAATEDTKIALTSTTDYETPFDFIEEGLRVYVQRTLFEQAIQSYIHRIAKSAAQCLQLAQIKASDIDLVILTGGSTEVPVVQAEFKKLFPAAAVADDNKLSSVGLGLAYDSKYKFGGS
jgi:hypothetical chaperone protein